MELIQKLKNNQIVLNNNDRLIELSNCKNHISYDKLSTTDWGFVYEKLIGQIFEENGFQVDYRGLSNPLFDLGIDLIVSDEKFVKFIQCKYSNSEGSKFSKQKIDTILYKGGNFISKYKLPEGKKAIFVLCVNSIHHHFSKKSNKVKMFPQYRKSGYPLVDYLLSMNYTQNHVKVEIVEIPME